MVPENTKATVQDSPQKPEKEDNTLKVPEKEKTRTRKGNQKKSAVITDTISQGSAAQVENDKPV